MGASALTVAVPRWGVSRRRHSETLGFIRASAPMMAGCVFEKGSEAVPILLDGHDRRRIRQRDEAIYEDRVFHKMKYKEIAESIP